MSKKQGSQKISEPQNPTGILGFVRRITFVQQPSKQRIITVNKQNMLIHNNRIKTTNYSILNFFPLNLYHQLSKATNLYFLVMAILQTIPAISNTNGEPSGLYPLLFVIGVVMIKDAYQEYYRYKKDTEQNNRNVQVLEKQNGNNFKLSIWQQLRVGNVIKLRKDDMLPCDVIMLTTSDDRGRCFVQTKNLDGETSLKIKKIPCNTLSQQKLLNLLKKKEDIQIQIDCPNKQMYKLHGNINIQGNLLPLGSKNLLMKGSSIKITHQCIGVCVYTGSDTKLSKNSIKFQLKKSNLEGLVDFIALIIIGIQIVIAIICAVMNLLLQGSKVKQLPDLQGSKFWITTGVWWVIMSYLVPISLVVTLEMVKLLQVVYMSRDERLYSKIGDCLPSYNSSSVNQNLGQIKFVFSDKTGTLTQNLMKFKKLVFQGKQYGNVQNLSSAQLQKYPISQNVEFQDKFFLNIPYQQKSTYLETLALCHSVVIQTDQNGVQNYTSSSPDQIALVNFAKLCGFQYLTQTNDQLRIMNKHTNKIQYYKLLAMLQFTSDRKRMSVIVQQRQSRKIIMYTKGADSYVIPLLKKGQKHLQSTQKLLDNHACSGLRTLVLAKRVLDPNYFKAWESKYNNAITSLQDQQIKIAAVCKQIQVDMELVGATAVQDKLQPNVVQTIQHLRRSGIIFYILTGDKRQTAINIATSCGLIDKDTQVIRPPEFQNIQKHQLKQQKISEWVKANSPFKPNSVFVLDAELNLPQIPLHPTVCYRCSPSHKQKIVTSVRNQASDQLTLAIGDGSNDVNMLVKAHVGVGIKGKQGNQVCRVADFVVGQFCILQKLVFYYGRQWYRKNAKLINYSYFKNIYHVFTVVGFAASSFFSGKVLYQSNMYQLFNVFFAAIPIIVFAVLDDQYTLKQSLNNTEIYKKGQNNQYFGQGSFWKLISLGIIFGVLCQIFVYQAMETGSIAASGRISSSDQVGMVLYFNIIFVLNIKVILLSHSITAILLFTVFGTLAWYWGTYFLLMNWTSPILKYSFYSQWRTPLIYLIHLSVGGVILLIDYAIKQYYLFEKRLAIIKNKQSNNLQSQDIDG